MKRVNEKNGKAGECEGKSEGASERVNVYREEKG